MASQSTLHAGALDAYLDRYLAATRPWATGTRYGPFAERWSSLTTVLPGEALERVTRVRAEVDPDGLLVTSQLPTALGSPR